MCSEHASSSRQPAIEQDVETAPPNYESIKLPAAHILSHLTDAHCHPTDLTHEEAVYDEVQLGGLASMATIVDDQDRVKDLSSSRPWSSDGASKTVKHGPKVVACFGYHPWFVHRYTLVDPLPTKVEHYHSIFFPSSPIPKGKGQESTATKTEHLLKILLPFLPDPLPFQPLLQKLRTDIQHSLDRGQLTMLGEVGLDGGARVRWPLEARHLYVERTVDGGPENQNKDGGEEGNQPQKEEEEEEWKRLTPFKTSMNHQTEILKAQLEIAVALGVNVSLHSVSSAGPTYETLIQIRDKHKTRFTNGINVDLHSGGGWSVEFWKNAERNLSNLYISPSIFITSRSASAVPLIRAVSPTRMLVESDSHDVRLSTRLVWAATVWIGRLRGWKIEGFDRRGEDGDEEDEWEMAENAGDEEEVFSGNGRLIEPSELWTVKTLEKNWARFMKIIPD